MIVRPYIAFAPDDPAPAADPVVEATPVPPAAEQSQESATPPAETPDARSAALAAIPDEHRSLIETELSEAAELRERWEPYASLELHDKYDAEQLAAVIELADGLTDPDTRDDLIRELAEAFDIGLEAAEVVATPTAIPELDALRAELADIKDQLATRDSATAEQDQAAAEAEQLELLQAEYAAVLEQHGRDFTPKQEERLGTLAEAFAKAGDATPLQTAYDVLADAAGDAEADFFTATAANPKAGESRPGRASTEAPPVDTLDEAERLLRERNRHRASA